MPTKRPHPANKQIGKTKGQRTKGMADGPSSLLDLYIRARKLTALERARPRDRAVREAARQARKEAGNAWNLAKKARSPKTPESRRLAVIRRLGEMAPGTYSEEEKRRLSFRGKEYLMPISSEELEHLGTLGKKEWCDYFGEIMRSWLEAHPQMRERIIANVEHLWTFTVWIAFQIWWRDLEYTSWLWDKVVLPEAKKIRVPASFKASLYQLADQDQTQSGDVLYFARGGQGAAAEFAQRYASPQYQGELRRAALVKVEEVISRAVYYVHGTFKGYMRRCARNYLLHELGIQKKSPSPRHCPVCDLRVDPPYICSKCGLGIPEQSPWRDLGRDTLTEPRAGQDSEGPHAVKKVGEAKEDVAAVVDEVVKSHESLRAFSESWEQLEEKIQDPQGQEGYARVDADLEADALVRTLSKRQLEILAFMQEFHRAEKRLPTNPEIHKGTHIPLRTVERDRQAIREIALEQSRVQ